MDQKVATFKLQKLETVFSTLDGFFEMECRWTWIGWLLTGLGHGQGLAQHTFGQNSALGLAKMGKNGEILGLKISQKSEKEFEFFF